MWLAGIWYTCSLFYGPDEFTVAWSFMLLGIAFSQVAGGPLASGQYDIAQWRLATSCLSWCLPCHTDHTHWLPQAMLALGMLA